MRDGISESFQLFVGGRKLHGALVYTVLESGVERMDFRGRAIAPGNIKTRHHKMRDGGVRVAHRHDHNLDIDQLLPGHPHLVFVLHGFAAHGTLYRCAQARLHRFRPCKPGRVCERPAKHIAGRQAAGAQRGFIREQ